MKRFLAYFKGEKLIVVFVILISLSTILNVFDPVFNSKLVAALTDKKFDSMVMWATAALIVTLACAFLRYGMTRISVAIRTNISKKLCTDLCEKALNIKGKFIDEFESGELTSITKENPSEMMERLNNIVTDAFGALASIVVVVYVAFLNIWCFILFAVFFLIIFLCQNPSLKREKKNADKGKKKGDSAKTMVNQMYRGIADIKIFDLKNEIIDRYCNVLDSEVEAAKEKAKAKATNRVFANVMFEVYTFASLCLGCYLMQNLKMEVAVFITIFLFRGHMYRLVFELSDIRSEWEEVKSLMERISKVLFIDESKLEKFGTINGSKADNHYIKFSEVSFSYGDGDLLKKVTAEIRQGEVVGLVGGSGSAKTTLIRLLSRYLEPNSGVIEVDGININKYSAKGYTDIISVASQQPFVFACSIRENLLMVKSNATEAEMYKSLEKVKMLGFVESLKDGLDTIITESLNLSGGQIQRIALARLFLKNTPIIILDEATSAVDNMTQNYITNLIKAESKNHIFIIIAHRMEAVKYTDRILFLNNGIIEDQGRHEELIERNKNYAKIVAALSSDN